MTQQKKTTTVAPKAPKKLIPRSAPKTETAAPVAEPVSEIIEPVLIPAEPVAAETPVAEIKQPLGKPAKAKKEAKAEKPVKAKKVKLVRDSYAMPETEYAQIYVLKKRLSGLKQEVKKSELLRAGIAVLCALNDDELASVMSHIERIKTGRPGK